MLKSDISELLILALIKVVKIQEYCQRFQEQEMQTTLCFVHVLTHLLDLEEGERGRDKFDSTISLDCISHADPPSECTFYPSPPPLPFTPTSPPFSQLNQQDIYLKQTNYQLWQKRMSFSALQTYGLYVGSSTGSRGRQQQSKWGMKCVIIERSRDDPLTIQHFEHLGHVWRD